jgi:site-specific recombinase XerD
MLSQYFESAFRIRVLKAGPAGTQVQSFAERLYESGYAQITARKHLRAVEHFVFWAGRNGTPVSDLTEESVERFGRHLQRRPCTHFGHADRHQRHSARLFLGHLHDMGVVSHDNVPNTVQDSTLLLGFCHWMRQLRGTCEATLYNYGIHIRRLVNQLGEEPEKYEARSLRQFVLAAQQYGWAAAKTCTTALRMFLRFLIAEGKCPDGLYAAVPVLAHWRLASLPRYLHQDEVERVIASCDASAPVGRRDRAIMLLLARLGLRAGDIFQLRLSDIDWKEASIHVCGKGGRHTRLPLTHEMGCALVEYLEYGRPRTDADAVFVSCRAPFGAFSSHCAVSVIVDRALRRAGVTRPSRGAAHLLRHSVASSMLRHGASLQDIALLLRHRSIETTQIYAKVDVLALRQIAQPWPEVQSC